MDDIAFMGVTS